MDNREHETLIRYWHDTTGGDCHRLMPCYQAVKSISILSNSKPNLSWMLFLFNRELNQIGGYRLTGIGYPNLLHLSVLYAKV